MYNNTTLMKVTYTDISDMYSLNFRSDLESIKLIMNSIFNIFLNLPLKKWKMMSFSEC